MGPRTLAFRVTRRFLHTNPKSKVLVLTGPTGCGKTNLLSHLADAFNDKIEVVSCDSVKCYREFNVGSNKPPQKILSRIPYHLIDICSLTDQTRFNVNDYMKKAHEATDKILQKGKIPVVVGGAGFYLDFYLYNQQDHSPPQWSHQQRAEQAQLFLQSWEENIAKITNKEAQAHLIKLKENNDKTKFARYLEIIQTTGGPPPERKRVPPEEMTRDYRCFFLSRDRTTLARVVDYRCEKMVDAGLLQEVYNLRKQGLLQDKRVGYPVGYKEAIEYFDTIDKFPAGRRPTFFIFLNKFQSATRQYARRQLTWFRNPKWEIFEWLESDKKDNEVVLPSWPDLAQHIKTRYDLSQADYLKYRKKIEEKQQNFRTFSIADKSDRYTYIGDAVIYHPAKDITWIENIGQEPFKFD